MYYVEAADQQITIKVWILHSSNQNDIMMEASTAKKNTNTHAIASLMKKMKRKATNSNALT
jgi:hypothetical protein